MHRWIPVATILLGLGTHSVRADEFADRVLRNYTAVVNGAKKVSDLPTSEQTELMYFIRFMNEEDGPPECRDAKRNARDAAQQLASAADELARCAQRKDFEDDCSRKFMAVKDAHSDYESAVSEVQSDCDN